MEPWQSWAIVILGGGVAYYYYRTQLNRRARARRVPSALERAEIRKREEGGLKRRRNDSPRGAGSGEVKDNTSSAPTSDRETAQKRREEKPKTSKSPVGQALELESDAQNQGLVTATDKAEEALSNKEFAQHLAGLKSGSSLAPPSKSEGRQRTLKQSRVDSSSSHLSVAESPRQDVNSQTVSATSSTTGGDADDDLSPAISPALGATFSGSAAPSGDVSDMLEAPAKGPSILRVTESSQPARAPRPQQQKAPVVQETKKQRQNRRKAEEKKASREQDEKERRVLLEKQLRTAREAEGRPAKNGQATSKAPPSAWASKINGLVGDATEKVKSTLSTDAPLLDTFNPTEKDRTTPSESKKPWERDLPSEEEQMRIINEMDPDAGWSTVPKGKRNKKKTTPVEGSLASNESSDTDKRGETTSAGQPEGADAFNAAASSSSGKVTSTVGDSDWSVV
ncbi:MAG: hypothetical protein M1833_006150 [Piccolia ochrophora]|nr:MAG: hypothetical protein M1833_006150 [Piccolia ochrophora]